MPPIIDLITDDEDEPVPARSTRRNASSIFMDLTLDDESPSPEQHRNTRSKTTAVASKASTPNQNGGVSKPATPRSNNSTSTPMMDRPRVSTPNRQSAQQSREVGSLADSPQAMGSSRPVRNVQIKASPQSSKLGNPTPQTTYPSQNSNMESPSIASRQSISKPPLDATSIPQEETEEQSPAKSTAPQVFKHLSPLQANTQPLIKELPQSLQHAKETPISQLPDVEQDNVPSFNSEDEDIERLMKEDDNLPIPQTRMARAALSRNSSQRSVSQSVSTDSPLLKRRQENQLKAGQASSNTKKRDQSPREVMARRSLSNDQLPHNLQLSVEQLEESLREFDKTMKDDHSATVRYLLHDAKKASGKSESSFIDKVSPFRAMKSVQYQSGEKIPSGSKVEKLDSFILKGKSSNNNSKINRNKCTLVAKSFEGNVPRVPKYSALTIVKRNVLSADDEKLRFIPYLGDAENQQEANRRRLERELEMAYSEGHHVSTRDAERLSQLRAHLDWWLQNLNIGWTAETLECFVLSKDDQCDHLRIKKPDRQKLFKSIRKSFDKEALQIAERFSVAFKTVFGLSLGTVVLPTDRLKELIESQKKSRKSLEQPVKSLTDDLGTFATLTCLICSAIDCQTHGEYTWETLKEGMGSDDEGKAGKEQTKQDGKEQIILPRRIAIQTDELLRNYDERRAQHEPETDVEGINLRRRHACSKECYLISDLENDDYEFEEQQMNDLRQMLIGFTEYERRACDLSLALDLPCWQVYREIQTYERTRERPTVTQSSLKPAKRPDWYDNRRKVLKGEWERFTNAHLHQSRFQANPDLAPLTALVFLATSSMNRECGPQCSSCGAVARLDPTKRHDDDLFTTGCQNVALQRGVAKRLIIGESQLEGTGFGLYMAEPARKGEFLSEYTGEVISNNEAERRGIIYDRKLLSFLFDLNNEWAVDAARLGNKARFINHSDSEENGLNCEAKICLVNGEHRIKFIALRDIVVGEELLFNYGKKFAEKHGLDKKLPKIKEGSKKGVVVGQEALDALDGMNERKRMSRNKMTAIRGGHSGRGRGKKEKARKSAPPREPEQLEEEEVEGEVDEPAEDVDVPMGDADAEEEEEEEDIYEEGDEGDGMNRRPRRNRSRPLRYTR
ncbi:hypothetical protein G7Y89_g11511 [Cudoniella acicularis]|uniref:SET domain-containing protein n=1 Tax=Cudoniella acicularis TaxID=354080 RepID=A0A8H4RBU4_9HELO|nr:hypothetical protein G7Y89_g11511 [Cudoniella acicularis]